MKNKTDAAVSTAQGAVPPYGTGVRLTGLAPVISRTTVLVVLGSFPGAASLAAQQYYAHPQNHFWKILQAIWPEDAELVRTGSYEIRSNWLLSKGLGLWDVYASCERHGSLDSAIRHAQPNDFAWLRAQCPRLVAVAHNGGESFRHAAQVQAALAATVSAAGPPQGAKAPPGGSAVHAVTSVGALNVHKLPSTSPANASWSFARKLAAWREVLALHGLV